MEGLHFSEWEDWRLQQRRHAVISLIQGYEGYSPEDMTKRRVAKLRRYQRELQFIDAEISIRAAAPTAPCQLVLFVLE